MVPVSEDEIEKGVLSVKDVDAGWRDVFTFACKMSGKTRGEAMTTLMRRYAEERYGTEGAERRYNDYYEEKEKEPSTSTNQSQFNDEEPNGPTGMD